MGSTYICFHLNSVSITSAENSNLDKKFQTVYKPLAKFLYSHQSFPFSISLNGELIQFMKKKKNELITIFKELADRKQLELLGGAYYDAVLPLLFNADRNGQIDLLTSEIRQSIGKRPRGMTIIADAWDSSLVNSITTCGIEYVVLDNPILKEYRDSYLPLLMSDLGKSVEIFPYYPEFIPQANTEPEEFISLISKCVSKAQKKSQYIQMEPNRVIVISMECEQIMPLIESKWFDKLQNYLLEQNNKIILSTPSAYRKEEVVKLPAYISCGISEKLFQSDELYGYKYQNKNKINSSFYNYLEFYNSGESLYRKILYTSNLVNQYKSDKIRKKTARDKLWLAQKGDAIIWNSNDIVNNLSKRQTSYKYLVEIEKTLNDDSKFQETITNFDYDGDGLKEYVCRMKNFFSYISLISGAMMELEVSKGGGNYVDNLTRKELWDGQTDKYRRGIFVDHVFSEEQFQHYIAGEPAGDGIFSRIQYTEAKYSQAHKEVQLTASAVALESKQSIYLKKKYIISSDGLYVQYILRNDSDKPLKIKFAVESNLTNVNYTADNQALFNLELVDSGNKIIPDYNNSIKDEISNGNLLNVSIVRASDLQNGISFVFEPNEKSGYYFQDIDFKRPDISGSIKTVQKCLVSTLFWDIELEPGMETEKNINFAIVSVKKQKKA